MKNIEELSAGDLRAEWPVDMLLSEEVSVLDDVVGQNRALQALKFGLSCRSRGYNIYVAGVTGSGRTTTVKSVAEKLFETAPVPSDWCYVYDFKNADSAKLLELPPGKAGIFRDDMSRLVETLHKEIPAAFQDEEVERQRSEATQDLREERSALFAELEQKARERNFQIQRSPGGIMTLPLKDEETMSDSDFAKLSAEEQGEIERKQGELNEIIRDTIARARELDNETRNRVLDINRRIALFAVGHVIDGLREKYRDHVRVTAHLIEVQEDILSNIEEFTKQEEKSGPLAGLKLPAAEPVSAKYLVNVLIDNSDLKGAPVVQESNPTHNNLVGRIERKAMYGTFYTDFTMIRPGAILQANGGCLIIQALDLLTKPYSYEIIKKVIKTGELKIEDMSQVYGIFPPQGLKPEPIPVDIKIILIGNAMVYHLLYQHDEDFRKIFKVKAEFARFLDKDEGSIRQYASFSKRVCAEENLPPLQAEAVAVLVRYGSGLVGDSGKLSLRFGDIADLIREGAYWAGQDGSSVVDAGHMQKAMDEKRFRSSLPEEVMQSFFADGTLMVDLTGRKTGQVNGLSVHDMGDFSFGRPSRITAEAVAGREGVVDIERKAELGGKIHRKGVLIISGFLNGRYGRRRPLSLTATICFEQSYDGVEGDSASAGELVAIVSSLSGLPVRQDLAITGSMNQKGEIQPIGGVNQKIEGFFDICTQTGLSGTQGVVIPRKNVHNLVLKREVIDAVADGKFHIYPIDTVDDAFHVLLDTDPGRPDADGAYPEGTVNALVVKRLEEIFEELKRHDEKDNGSDAEE